MISDVLFDAVREIEEYQRSDTQGVCYGDPVFVAKLEFVKGVMTALRAELDCVPHVKPYISPAGQAGIQSVAWRTSAGIHQWQIESNGHEG